MTGLARSYLFAPGNNGALLRKVFAVGADAVVLDLEDAVPESEKANARRAVAGAVSGQEVSSHSATYVRINGTQSSHWRADIDAVVAPGLQGLRVPKAETLESLCRVHDAVSDRERALGLAHRSVGLMATIESARGLTGIHALARAPRLVGFTFGSSDFCADIAADPFDEAATLFARSRLVVASRVAGLAPPVASVFTRLDDETGLRADTERQKRLGFFGRSAIHPRQVAIIHEAFEPTAGELDEAGRILEAHAQAGREGSGATRMGGQFVDLAVVRRARAILDLRERVKGAGPWV